MTERIIELGLRNDGNGKQDNEKESASTSALAAFNARLLGVISDTAVESDSLKTSEFRAKLQHYRRRLESGPDGDPRVVALAQDCLTLCQNYLDRARKYLLEREREFAEVIEVMRIALGKLAGDATAFNTRLLGSSERINRLTEIEDIRELKKRITQEVQDLNRVVREKQKQDEMQYAKLSRRVEVLQASLTHTKQQASTDPLTRVANRRSFDESLGHWVATAGETGRPFVLAILDLDNFKKINDSHGHQVGDRVLVCAAQWLSKSIRSDDVLARYGGEEFVVMLSDLQLAQAEAKFTELLAGIAKSNYEYKKDGEECTVSFTASCGLAEFDMNESAEDLLRRADEALYVAKRTGKNRVVVAKTEKSLWKSLTSRGLPRTKQKS